MTAAPLADIALPAERERQVAPEDTKAPFGGQRQRTARGRDEGAIKQWLILAQIPLVTRLLVLILRANEPTDQGITLRAAKDRDEARKAGAALIAEGVKARGRTTFIYVNNRLEGNALSTIEAMVDMAA